MSDSQLSKQAVENQIYSKALKDEAFKESLKNDPKSVIENEFGIKLPDGVNIHVVENSATEFYLAIPGSSEERELSEDELSTVAGGGWIRPNYTDGDCID